MTDKTDKNTDSKAGATDEKKDAVAQQVEDRETSKEYADNWPDNAPQAVQDYEELRKNPPEGQEHVAPSDPE